MDITEDITADHLHAKADEYEAQAKRFRAAAKALEDPETGERRTRGRRRRAQSNGAKPAPPVAQDAVLKQLTPEGVKSADIRTKIKGTEQQILRRLKELEAAGKAKRTGERRTTRWHKVSS